MIVNTSLVYQLAHYNNFHLLQSEKMFKKINKAYRILTDPELRQLYDQYGKSAVKYK